LSKVVLNAKHGLVGNQVIAKYHQLDDPMYKHNPFNEALPPILNVAEAAERMRRSPAYDEKERLLSPEKRIQAAQRIVNMIEPLPKLLDLEQAFSRMIHNGYLARNPLSSEWNKQMMSAFRNLSWGSDYDKPVIRSSASGFTMVGASGVGKTTAIDSVLSLYPQLITHTQYKGQSLDQYQLVWLKLECPKDGSTKGLCLNFFQTIDTVLGSNYYKKFGKSKRTADELLPDMALLASGLGLGVLVIDEIQRLSVAKSEGAQKMLNFFVQLANSIGVPVVLVGTFKVMELLRKEFAQVRRGTGQGDFMWTNMTQDEVWDYFVDVLWEYQWTNEKTPLTPALSQALFVESQGIIDIAVKLYMFAQWSIIGYPSEKITTRLIKNVAKEHLNLAKPIMDALKSGDPEKLAMMDDVLPADADVWEFLQKSKERVTVEGRLNTLRNQQKTAGHTEVNDSPLMHIAQWLVDANIDPRIAREAATEAVGKNGSGYDIQEAMWDAMTIARAIIEKRQEEKSKRQPRKKAKKQIYSSLDLREIAQRGLDKKISVYKSFVDSDVIKSALEFHTA
jgi:hypothetical protein